MPNARRLPRRAIAAVIVLPVVLVAACTSSTSQGPPPTAIAPPAVGSSTSGQPSSTISSGSGTKPGASVSTSASAAPAPTTELLGGLDRPWSIAMLPGGSGLVSVRNTGEVYHVAAPGASTPAVVAGRLPISRTSGEGGLLGLAVRADFEAEPVVYAYYSTENDNRVAAVPWAGGRLGTPKVIFSGIPRGTNHNGGRIAFGPDGYLYVGTGEAGDAALAQNLGSLGGKILRITAAGDSAPGNPFGGSPIWSYGHRNVQGLTWDSQKRLWASEFGANTHDELNLIKPGQNYGWPEVEGRADKADFVDPVVQWPPSEMSPSGTTVGPDGAVYIAALRGESVWRVPINDDGTAGTPSRHLEGTYGRIRDLHFVTPDRVWILTNNGTDDRLLSLPATAVGLE
ncbi:MAG: PQQ-dependent sugar dehydrogenase [Humibacillus sp.]|nr:PQQ-dependent sugar dehydrogenase [Humibacillus sp.]MDN5777014.1 PQQ-dependent sugar dehydrogenase [Humibacillus sp.]